jgi:hypothetical protein
VNLYSMVRNGTTNEVDLFGLWSCKSKCEQQAAQLRGQRGAAQECRAWKRKNCKCEDQDDEGGAPGGCDKLELAKCLFFVLGDLGVDAAIEFLPPGVSFLAATLKDLASLEPGEPSGLLDLGFTGGGFVAGNAVETGGRGWRKWQSIGRGIKGLSLLWTAYDSIMDANKCLEKHC